MKSQSFNLFFLLPVTVIAALVFVSTIVRMMLPSVEAEVLPPLSAEQRGLFRPASSSTLNSISEVADPDFLLIPSIDVKAKIEKVGMTTSGAMATPSSFKTVGWYRYGPKPGQAGAAVLAGHVDNALALAGVFKRLKDVKVGDTVAIQTIDGSQLKFRVKKVQSYEYQEVPLDEVFGHTATAQLQLITCDGSWLKKEKTYNKRLIVFTELES